MTNYNFPTIRYGADNAPAVILIQGMLYDTGYFDDSKQVDGVFGDMTKQAVLCFQNDHGCCVDGIVGNETWKKLIGEWWCNI